jgi:(S)-3,5-dihydroxyphenylglycine transaminase
MLTNKTRSSLTVMNFLNEISSNYPHAISLVSGRPTASYFDVPQWLLEIPRFVQYFSGEHGYTEKKSYDLLGQYGKTNGIINDLISKQLLNDESIACSADQILVTAGCQEAMSLCAEVLCCEPRDVILVRNPTYIGITGAADSKGISIESFEPINNTAIGFYTAIDTAIERIKITGKRVKVLYLIPDFDNPTGELMDQDTREAVLAVCTKHQVLILEDNPYGMFNFEQTRIPTLYSLDSVGCVIYLGTYSKTLCPALRIGFTVTPSTVWGNVQNAQQLMQRLSQAKSFGTCNTSQITQAIVGGVLLRESCSLKALTTQQTQLYQNNRDVMLAALDAAFKDYADLVHWNIPMGGFFLVITLPFEFGAAELALCASDYQILCLPVSFFSIDGSQRNKVRLAYSNIDAQAITEGITRFSHFIKNRLLTQPVDAP